jgi:hypothetical protein
MARRPGNNSGLRNLLIADRERFMERWQIPGKPDEHLEALRAGEEVLVGSAQLMRALMHAGLRHDDFAFGGRHYKTVFVLGENDQLAEMN